MNREEPSAPVPARDKQAEEDLWQRHKAGRGVWTEPMPVALEGGLKGKKWFSLIDKGTCQPKPVKRVWIDKPGSAEKRPLGIPTVTGRVVPAAVRMVIEPIFENRFAEHSHGFRPGRGCKDALRRVEELLRAGRPHVVEVDIKGYFDAMPHDRLMALVREQIADDMVVLCRSREEADTALEKLREWMAGAVGSTTNAGSTATSRSPGSSACGSPGKLNMRASVTEQTADWRAGCGRSARPVRRGERGESSVPTSIRGVILAGMMRRS